MKLKKLIFPIAVLFSLIVLVSCLGGGTAETISEESVELRGTKWQLTDRYNLDAKIEFSKDMTKIYGYDGCNDFTADIILKNYFIEFSNFESTELYCEDMDDYDRDFRIALSKVRDYTATKNDLSMFTLGTFYIGKKRNNNLRFNRIDQ